MLASSGPGAISPLRPRKTYFSNTDHEVSAQGVQPRKFDSVTLSSNRVGERRSYLDMVSRLSQQVRTTTTTGDIQTLREQVSAGTYQPDPAAIAARMLFINTEE